MADLADLNAYSVVNSRKLYGAPTDFTFCIKARRRGGGGGGGGGVPDGAFL